MISRHKFRVAFIECILEIHILISRYSYFDYHFEISICKINIQQGPNKFACCRLAEYIIWLKFDGKYCVQILDRFVVVLCLKGSMY